MTIAVGSETCCSWEWSPQLRYRGSHDITTTGRLSNAFGHGVAVWDVVRLGPCRGG